MLIALLLTNCAQPATTSLPDKTATSIPTSTVISLTETPSATTSAKLILTFQCPNVATAPPYGFETNGTLILRRYKSNLFTIDLSTGNETQIPKSGSQVGDGSVSPDGKILAYYLFDREGDNYSLVFADDSNKILKTIPWQDDWYMIGNWINSNQLAVFAYEQRMVLLSPYSNQQEYIDTRGMGFPDYSAYDLNTSWVLFDPNLKKAVYAATGSEQVLFDIENQRVLAKVPWWVTELIDASWSQDGKYVAMVGRNPKYLGSDKSIEEIYIFSQDGLENKMSHFADYYNDGLALYHPSWSPDGKYIAFWMYSTSYDNPYYNLVILDADARLATSYCISSDLFTGPRRDWLPMPIWSPDSRQVVVENYHSEIDNRVIIVDITTSIAIQIAENSRPVGWMDEAP